jgi:rhamnose transport system ATP-binding protein
MVGRELSAVLPKQKVPIGEPVIELRGLGCRAAGVHNINLAVRAGEIVGLAGLVGAGRTELARVLFGITPADAGQTVLHGKQIIVDSPIRAIELGVAYVPEDRRRHGVVLELPVATNISLAVLRQLSECGEGRLAAWNPWSPGEKPSLSSHMAHSSVASSAQARIISASK